MTDREMLELAAKAAGYVIDHRASFLTWRESERLAILNTQGGHTLWEPLTDDGDALRLALKLGVLLDVRYIDPAVQRHNRVTYWIDPAHGLHVQFDDFGTDLAAATRRAIVRAAAAIGKAMP